MSKNTASLCLHFLMCKMGTVVNQSFGGDGHIHCHECGNDFTCSYICRNLSKLYTLNICSLLYGCKSALNSRKLLPRVVGDESMIIHSAMVIIITCPQQT